MAITNVTSLTRCCGFCGNTRNLLRCSGCKVMFYCNREHQATHRAVHKSACNGVATMRHIFDAEEQDLRSNPIDFFNWFEGNFCMLPVTHHYMYTRFALVQALQEVKTHDSLQAQLDHLMDMLQLDRHDEGGMCNLIPALMLRLNKDQECYDFVKWWNEVASFEENIEQPYLDVKNTDVYESVEWLCASWNWIYLIHLVAITLLKIKLSLDLTALQNSVIVGQKVPREILDIIQGLIPQSPIIAGNRDILKRENHTETIEKLTAQIDALYMCVKEKNKHFWPALLEPGRHLTVEVERIPSGSVEEMQAVLRHSYDSWAETPGAIEFIKEKVKKDASG